MAKFLLTDDSKFMRKIIKNIILQLGHEVVAEASNGLEALHAYKKAKPDIVTMDITMPEYDGIYGVKAIRSWDPKARVIIVSAMGQQSYILDAMRAGAVDFLVKPIISDQVEQAIKKCLQPPVNSGRN
ncbi:response regulator [Heliorestis convoluta]|uniref:Stage 0 sporulation protein A homolog n=1 Tax=Heliorestis convoluta TaxID=356322 RepID=A0A5Q2MWD3_9FIRM|nr:response regulator [Heliorestis convoluta]QGG46764.1 chemotaxis protein CheY [Heliorestis convoluta]